MFQADSELAHISNHISWLFHATIGLDPLGNFSSIDQLAYEVPTFEYNEMGRNHAPVRLPFREAGQPGELTLRWGMIVRSKLFEWIHDVEAGKDFQRHVYIFQLSRKHLPLRVYHLTGAWPTSWKASEFSTEDKTALASEEVTLVYDQIDMMNLSAVAMLGELVDEPLSDLIDSMRPPSLDERHAATAGLRTPWQQQGIQRRFSDIYVDPEIGKQEREARWNELRSKWVERRDEWARVARDEREEFVATKGVGTVSAVDHVWKPSDAPDGQAGNAGLPSPVEDAEEEEEEEEEEAEEAEAEPEAGDADQDDGGDE